MQIYLLPWTLDKTIEIGLQYFVVIFSHIDFWVDWWEFTPGVLVLCRSAGGCESKSNEACNEWL